jgi:hypothetical protein
VSTDTVVVDRAVLADLLVLADLCRIGSDTPADVTAKAQARQLLEGSPDEEDLPVAAAKRWPTNAHLIADVARLGYLDGRVIDVTYGEHGGFWKVWRPEHLVAHDLVTDGVGRIRWSMELAT